MHPEPEKELPSLLKLREPISGQVGAPGLARDTRKYTPNIQLSISPRPPKWVNCLSGISKGSIIALKPSKSGLSCKANKYSGVDAEDLGVLHTQETKTQQSTHPATACRGSDVLALLG